MIDGNTLIRFIFFSVLRTCLNFPLKVYQFLSLFSACFLVFTRQIARYPPLKTEKYP